MVIIKRINQKEKDKSTRCFNTLPIWTITANQNGALWDVFRKKWGRKKTSSNNSGQSVLTTISRSAHGVWRIPRSFPCLSSPQVEDSDQMRSHSPDWTAKRKGKTTLTKKHVSQIPTSRAAIEVNLPPPTHPKSRSIITHIYLCNPGLYLLNEAGWPPESKRDR